MFHRTYVKTKPLENVFTSWFVAYVGIIVAALTSPTFGMETLGRVLFAFGFACYAHHLAVTSIAKAAPVFELEMQTAAAAFEKETQPIAAAFEGEQQTVALAFE